MNNNVIGTNETSIDQLIVNLSDLTSNVSTSLNEISALISETKLFLEGEAGDSIRNKFFEIEQSFPIIISNLESYKDDFIRVRNNYIGYDLNLKTSEIENSNLKGGEFDGVK